MIRLVISMHTDPGPRDSLEDVAQPLFISLCEPGAPDFAWLSLFDGAGGQAAGDVASAAARRLCTTNAAEFVVSTCGDELTPEQIIAALKRFLHAANDEILRLQDDHPEWFGMATTAVCALIHKNTLIGASCGDSRCYLVRDGAIRQLTRDDSVVEDLIRAELISRKEAILHPRRHEITEYLGKRSGAHYQTIWVELEVGDDIVLCSDGLTDVVSDHEIAQIITARRSRGDHFVGLARELVDTALAFGTTDNVTVLCARCEAEPSDVHALHTSTAAYPTEAARVSALLLNQRHGVQ